jgi:chitinase
MQSNWAKLEPERSDGDTRGDYWVSWQAPSEQFLPKTRFPHLTNNSWSTGWRTAGEYGEGDDKYRQRLIQYAEDQPLPEGIASEEHRVSVLRP